MYKLAIFGVVYMLVAIWVSSGLCFVFFGGEFLDAPYDAVFYFWQDLVDVKGERLKLLAATLIPFMPAFAIIFGNRFSHQSEH